MLDKSVRLSRRRKGGSVGITFSEEGIENHEVSAQWH